MKLKFLGILGIIFYFAGCASQEVVTQSTYKMLGDTFSTFRFYISRDVILKEIIPLDVASDRKNTRVTITAYNKVVNIKKSTAGRVQGEASPERLKIAFEQLRDGTKPAITFVQKNNDGRYYFEYIIDDWTVLDNRGKYVTVRGPGIEYNGSQYLLEFKGKGEPYLLYDQDIKVKNNSRNMRGLR